MLRNYRLSVVASGAGLAASFLISSNQASAKAPKLSLAETNVSACPAKEPGAPRRCAPRGGFSVIETQTEMSDFRLVVREETGFQIFLEPAGCAEARYHGPVQWRQFDEQPFAVIQTVKCAEPSEGTTATKGRLPKSRTIVVVRGLPGFEGLHQDFEASKRKNASKDAVEAADKFLKTRWPKIEEERLAAEAVAEKAAEKEAASETTESAPETVVPASERKRAK